MTRGYAAMQYAVLLISLAAAAVQTVLISLYYEPDAFFYRYGSVAPTVFHYILAAIVLLLILSGLLYRRAETTEPPRSALSAFAGLLCALMLAVTFIVGVVSWVRDPYAATGGFFAVRVTLVLLAVFTVPAAIYLTAFPLRLYRRPKKVVLAGIFVVLWAAVSVMRIYFLRVEPISAPLRVLRMMSLLAVMFYFVYELRFLAGTAANRMFRAVSSIAVLLLTVTALPQLVMTAAGVLPVTNELPMLAFMLAADLYIVSRMFAGDDLR